MADVSQEIRDQFKECLVKINTRRASKLVITNDQRAKALGMYFDANGVLRTSKCVQMVSKHDGLVANWPELPANRR